ncbi:MAG: alpha/beta hydrolase [Bryobacteraceae bacterium]|nr:alpha/beta hydrolase [Bryobacteraceae bacterium]
MRSLFLFLLPALLPTLLRGWQATPVAPVSLPEGFRVEQNIAYSQHPQTVLDVYNPPSQQAAKKRCGVLNIHGGGWVNGSKEAVVERNVLPWLKKGCVVANVEYRLAAVATAPAAVEDVLRAAEWFSKNAKKYGVDNDRIIASGTSAGGHLALMTGLTSKAAGFGPTGKIAAVINFYGITDVEDQLGGDNQRQYAVTWVPQSEGRMELARRVSPMTWVRKDMPPVLTIHGTIDPTVPYEHGVRLTKALRDAGADAEMISVNDGEHGRPLEKFDAVWPQIFEFLTRRGFLKDR